MIPSTLQIDGRTWHIVMSKSRPHWVDSGAVGMCSRKKRRIWIKKRHDIEEEIDTLAHEILHACCGASVTTDLEEYFVATTERALASVLRDNDLSFCRRRRACS